MGQHYHFIGIGGIGMSGLARILLSRDVSVSGSDLASSYVTEGLIKIGAKIFFGHSAQHVSPDMRVVYTSDIREDNPELLAAKDLKCTLLHRSELLAELMVGYKTVAVAGTHGKTTTTALLTHVLKEADYDPAFAVGGVLPGMRANAGHGTGAYFVAEADESDGTFLRYQPWGAIVTNIDLDHMDHYKTERALEESFLTFMQKVPSPEQLFFCGDDSRLAKLNLPGVSYGFDAHNKLRATNFSQEGWHCLFDIHFQNQTYHQVRLARIGRHNVLNALATFGFALQIGITEARIREALQSFAGVVRRCEKKGEVQEISFIDDYAHHPTEIACTLRGLREAVKEKRLIAVYQPHRFTRTRDCLGTFGNIFDEVDEVWITDIYGARETPIPGLSSALIIDEVKKASHIICRYIPRDQLVESLASYLRPHDLVITLGAGDITRLSLDLLNHFKELPPTKLKVGLLFGGKSVEHAVSLQSAQYILNFIDPSLYEMTYFGIDTEGSWISGPSALERLKQGERAEEQRPLSPIILEELMKCDLLFPILHGPFGEDGTLQGLFEILGKAYIGSDHRASALCMDKALTKNLMQVKGIPIIPFIDFNATDWKRERPILRQKIMQKLTLPVFVKPLHLGSTIGVKKVEAWEELDSAIQAAFEVDERILVENGLQVREIEFALLGNHWVTVLPPGEVCNQGKIYSYEDKYGSTAAPFYAKAPLSPKLIQEGMHLAKTAYQAAGCTGLARIDFFLDEQGNYWLNEINPIPGCTPTSAFPQMCEANGITGKQLFDRLVICALERKRSRTLISDTEKIPG